MSFDHRCKLSAALFGGGYAVFQLFLHDFMTRETLEFFSMLLLIGFFLSISCLQSFSNRPLTQKIRDTGLILFPLWLGTFILSKLNTPNNFSVYSLQAGLFVVVIFSAVFLLVCLKSLIFVQESRNTARHFRFLLIIVLVRMFFRMLYVSEYGQDRSFVSSMDQESVFMTFSWVLILLLSFINGFRCKWIHYLNMQQKTLAFFLGSVFYAIAISLFMIDFSDLTHLNLVSISFFSDVKIIFAVYGGMALLGLLLQMPSAGLMDRKMQEINFLHNMGASLGSVLDHEELIDKCAEMARKIVQAPAVWIELKSGAAYYLAGTRGLDNTAVENIPVEIKNELRFHIMQSGGVFIHHDLGSRRKGMPELSRNIDKASSLIGVRIQFKKRQTGFIYAVSKEKFAFDEDRRGLFMAFADQVGVALENSRLVQLLIDQKVYREELRLAHEAQMRLLPAEMPNIKGIDLQAYCNTANEIGGDFYDLIVMGDNRLDIIVGDVSGKGASAAFYMAELKGVISALAGHFDCPLELMIEVNDFVKQHFEANTFVTMFYGMYYPRQKTLHWVRAGHPPAVQINNKSSAYLESEGIGLGLATHDLFRRTLKKKTIRLKQGDIIFIFTDGLIEARNAKGEEFGENYLKERLVKYASHSVSGLIENLKQDMDRFAENIASHDDVTLVAMKVLERD